MLQGGIMHTNGVLYACHYHAHHFRYCFLH